MRSGQEPWNEGVTALPVFLAAGAVAVIAILVVLIAALSGPEPSTPTAHELSELGLGTAQQNKDAKFFVGKGCEKCFQTGYRGRTGIYELMMISDEIQELIYQRATAGSIKRLALKAGMQTLRMDGARKALAGITTVAEVLRVTQADV